MDQVTGWKIGMAVKGLRDLVIAGDSYTNIWNYVADHSDDSNIHPVLMHELRKYIDAGILF